MEEYNSIAYDLNGIEIKSGDLVIWRDPENGKKHKYTVFGEPNEDMVQLYSKYGECEALPHECIVIK